ncbi:MAG: AraC family transcriptional regulator [Sphingomonas hengshuiensis]|nr:MAG: AraC family transcriptional regulator [Sphingomonas hengshuiensis]
MRRMGAQQKIFDFYLLPDFSLQASSSAIEALRLANETIGWDAYNWRLLTSDGSPVRASCGTLVLPDLALDEVRRACAPHGEAGNPVICGGSTAPGRFRPLEFWLRESRFRTRKIAALGTGVYALAHSGLATGRRCSVHWEQYPTFTEEYPDVDSKQTAFEVDGNLFSCPGGDSAFDLFLTIVEIDFGLAVVNRICEKAIAHRVREEGERQRLPMQTRLGISHSALIAVIKYMEANILEPLSLKQVVNECGLSRRQIERLFQQELGQSPARYYLNIRLERAHLLLRTSSLPITDVSVACGFASGSHFSKVYKEAYGCTPNVTRMTAACRRKKRHENYTLARETQTTTSVIA